MGMVKNDFYKQILEDDGEELIDGVLTPKDITPKINNNLPAIVLEIENDLVNSSSKEFLKKEFLDYFSTQIVPSVFGDGFDTLEGKINIFFQRVSEGAPFYVAHTLLKGIDRILDKHEKPYENKSLIKMFKCAIAIEDEASDRIKKPLIRRRDNGTLELGDLVRTIWKGEDEENETKNIKRFLNKKDCWSVFTTYVQERKKFVKPGLKGMIVGFDRNKLVVYIPQTNLNYKSEWTFLKEYPEVIHRNLVVYLKSELEILIPTELEIIQLRNLMDKMYFKIDRNEI